MPLTELQGKQACARFMELSVERNCKPIHRSEVSYINQDAHTIASVYSNGIRSAYAIARFFAAAPDMLALLEKISRFPGDDFSEEAKDLIDRIAK